MTLDDLLRVFSARPTYQRLFLAFTVGTFLSCAARVSASQEPEQPGAGPTSEVPAPAAPVAPR